MSALQEPLTTEAHDVSGLDGFLLNTEKLMASELWALATGDEFKAAVGLWCRAWKQSPPGSLPNDERVLAAFSGAGANWRRVRDVALRGFVECSDGRLYHTTLCEDAIRAAEAKRKRHDRTKNATKARSGQRDDERDADRNDTQEGNVTPPHRREVEGKGREEEEYTQSARKDSEFNTFWADYPEMGRVSWTLAEEEFYKLTEKERLEAVASLPAFKDWIAKQHNDYTTLHAARYLSQKRFKDHTAEAPKGKPAPQRVPVYVGTEQFEAWKAHKGGRLSDTDIRIDGQPIRRGWWVPSEWPPGRRAETKSIPPGDDLTIPAFLRRNKTVAA